MNVLMSSKSCMASFAAVIKVSLEKKTILLSGNLTLSVFQNRNSSVFAINDSSTGYTNTLAFLTLKVDFTSIFVTLEISDIFQILTILRVTASNDALKLFTSERHL